MTLDATRQRALQGETWKDVYSTWPWPFNRLMDARMRWREMGRNYSGIRLVNLNRALKLRSRLWYIVFLALGVWLVFFKEPWKPSLDAPPPLPHAKTLGHAVQLFMQYYRTPQPELFVEAMPWMITPEFSRKVTQFQLLPTRYVRQGISRVIHSHFWFNMSRMNCTLQSSDSFRKCSKTIQIKPKIGGSTWQNRLQMIHLPTKKWRAVRCFSSCICQVRSYCNLSYRKQTSQIRWQFFMMWWSANFLQVACYFFCLILSTDLPPEHVDRVVKKVTEGFDKLVWKFLFETDNISWIRITPRHKLHWDTFLSPVPCRICVSACSGSVNHMKNLTINQCLRNRWQKW